MTKFISFWCYFFSVGIALCQSIGAGFKSPIEAYNNLDDNGKALMLECSRIAGVPIDSMSGVDSIYNSFKYVANDYNVQVIVVCDHKIKNYVPNSHTSVFSENIIVEDYFGKTLDRPVYMVFVFKDDEGMKITLQKYY